MGYTAFELHSVIENIPVKIESFTVYNNSLFVGTADGVLLVYTISYSPLSTTTATVTSTSTTSGNSKNNNSQQNQQQQQKRFTATLAHSKKDFGKSAITQLCTIPELGILVSLSDGLIRLHTLLSSTSAILREIDTLKNAKGQSVKGIYEFAIKKHHSQFTMAITVKRGLTILTYSPKETTFLIARELMLPETPKTINWSGDWICVGYKREYSLVDPKSTQPPKKIFNTGVSQQTTLGLSLPEEVVIAINSK
jgi:hypothetical protein